MHPIDKKGALAAGGGLFRESELYGARHILAAVRWREEGGAALGLLTHARFIRWFDFLILYG
jgi:hypothetical protein